MKAQSIEIIKKQIRNQSTDEILQAIAAIGGGYDIPEEQKLVRACLYDVIEEREGSEAVEILIEQMSGEAIDEVLETEESIPSMTLEQIKKATGKQIAQAFQVTLNAGDAASNYLMSLGWGYGISAAMEAASDFIDNDEDLDGLEKLLKIIQAM